MKMNTTGWGSGSRWFADALLMKTLFRGAERRKGGEGRGALLANRSGKETTKLALRLTNLTDHGMAYSSTQPKERALTERKAGEKRNRGGRKKDVYSTGDMVVNSK